MKEGRKANNENPNHISDQVGFCIGQIFEYNSIIFSLGLKQQIMLCTEFLGKFLNL